MIVVNRAMSTVTGRLEECTVCPQLVSEFDGKVIVDGTPDVDLLDMHDLAIDPEYGILPKELCTDGSRTLTDGAAIQVIQRVARQSRKLDKVNHQTVAKQKTRERIEANEARWHSDYDNVLDDDVIGDLTDHRILAGFARLVADITAV